MQKRSKKVGNKGETEGFEIVMAVVRKKLDQVKGRGKGA